MKLLVLAAMFYCHIIDDYKLQGILANFKQKSWWKENAPDKLYKYDYIIALIEHAFCWTFSIHIPVFVYSYFTTSWKPILVYVVVFLFDWVLHAIVDDGKANEHKINLIQDQVIHIAQILLTWMVYLFN